MSVARTGLPHSDRTPTRRIAATPRPHRDDCRPAAAPPTRPPRRRRHGSGPPRDSRTRVRELVARERATGTRLHARDVAAAAGISERRADELLRAVRAEDRQP